MINSLKEHAEPGADDDLQNRIFEFSRSSAALIEDSTPWGVLPCGPGYLSAPPTSDFRGRGFSDDRQYELMFVNCRPSEAHFCKPDDSLAKRPLRPSRGKSWVDHDLENFFELGHRFRHARSGLLRQHSHAFSLALLSCLENEMVPMRYR